MTVGQTLQETATSALTTGGAGEAMVSHDGGHTESSEFRGVWCPELELSTGALTAKVVAGPNHGSVRALVRMNRQALGFVTVAQPPSSMSSGQLCATARRHFSPAEIDAAAQAALPSHGYPAEGAPLVSVIVCTRNRSAILPGCLGALAAVTYPNLEIVVVDNAPEDDSTRHVVTEAADCNARFRYVLESRPGLSHARNRGLIEARGQYIAYTDDDVWVDPDWISQVVRAFSSGRTIGCVTGSVCTASLDTEAEIYCDTRLGSWSSRWEAQTFDLLDNARDDALYPYSAGLFGTGANFAFTRSMLVDLGAFDAALGAGTLSRGGEDLDIFVRVLRAGYAIRYEPSAVVWHHHRSDEAGLLAQMYGYGSGLTAYLTKILLQRDTQFDVLRRVPAGICQLMRLRRGTRERLHSTVAADQSSASKRALATELRGYLAGPALYLRARRRLARSAPV